MEQTFIIKIAHGGPKLRARDLEAEIVEAFEEELDDLSVEVREQ